MNQPLAFETDLGTEFVDPPEVSSLPKATPPLLLALVLGGAGGFSLFWSAQNMTTKMLFLIIGIVLLVAMGLVLLVAAVRAGKRSSAKRQHTLRELGIRTRRLESKERSKHFLPVGHLDNWLKQGSRGLTEYGESEVETSRGPTPIRIFNHRYTVNTGKNSTTILHSVAAAPAPSSWPLMRLTGENVLTKITKKLGASDIQLDNAAFNDKWVVKCDSEDFAIVALSPQVQEFLTEAPNHEAWAIGRGTVACIHRGNLKPDKLREIAERAATLRALISADLDAF